jgi:hypothetical protein
MKFRLTIRDLAELIGVIAILASLIFVGLQMRQEQELFASENAISRLETVIELNNAIVANSEVWALGNRGEPLTETEFIEYERILNIYNEVTFLSYVSGQARGNTSGSVVGIFQFASFLEKNPGAFKIWNDRETVLERELSLLLNAGGPNTGIGQEYRDRVREYVDQLSNAE